MLTLVPSTNDPGLVRAAKAGDRRAFGNLYRQYARLVHGVLLAYVRPEDADDLVQDVFVRAMRQVESLRDDCAFGGWLCSIARRAATDHVRTRRETQLTTEAVAGGARPDETSFRVLHELQKLPEAYRETLALRLIEGFTGPEIAARVGLSPESVRVNLCRGMKLLRERLEGTGDD